MLNSAQRANLIKPQTSICPGRTLTLPTLIDRHEEILTFHCGGPHSARIVALLPKAAVLYRAKIDRGLEGNPVAATAARTVLRGLVSGKIDLVPEPDGSLWAVYGLQRRALLEAVAGQTGSGGGLRAVPLALALPLVLPGPVAPHT